MTRSRALQRHSSASSASSSSTSPERGADDDNDSFMLQPNDSASSLGLSISHDISLDASRQREYEERCRVSPVHRLPAELLISIFARLSTPHDLQTCMLVCKDWARNSVGLLWHRPQTNKWDGIHSVVQSIRKADKFFAYQDLVKRLNMSTLATQVSDGTIMGMLECKRIERLTLTNCTKLTDVSLAPLVDGNRSLLALDVTGLDQLSDKTMMIVADNCLRLQGLNVTGCRKLTDTSIAAIAKNCRHLKRLKFNSCAQLTDVSILTVADHASHLLEIDLYGLALIESPAITALLSNCSHLRELRLAHCIRISDSAFTSIPSGSRYIFHALRILDLTDCADLGDKGVEKIVQTCPRLRNLILAKCRQLTDRAVFAITKLGKNLHYIHLGHCARITDVSVEALAKACNRIRYIDLACCSNLTDNSVIKLAALPKLKRIGLVKCAGITDRSIYALAMGEVNSRGRKVSPTVLERVHLSYCTLLTLEGVHVLLNNCPKLTHLSLTGVQAFLRDELLTFCREAPPEFNDHQRDVFCVFSGTGVQRLRQFLVEQKAELARRAAQVAAEVRDHPGEPSDIDVEVDDNAPDSGGSSTPIVSIDVHSQFQSGQTPVVPTPSAFQGFGVGPQQAMSYGGPPGPWGSTQGLGNFQSIFGGPSSAPANLTGGALWAAGHVPVASAGAFGGAGAAQHVTGMMGAAALDDVDEGDEAFGEGSEIMDDHQD